MGQLLNPGVIEYEAVILQSDNARNSWARVDFPYDIKKLYGKGNLVPAIIKYDDIEYRGSITSMGGPYPMLLIKREILKQLNKKAGDKIHVSVTLDDQPRTVEVPIELSKLLDKDRTAKENFEAMAYTHRKEYSRWVGEAKQMETRERRALKATQMLRENKKYS